jgi:hypothetical protein
MSNQKNEGIETPATSHHESAQAFVEQLHRMRDAIPHFVIPKRKGGRRTLNMTASLPPAFVEQTAVARTHNAALVRGEGTTPAETRDLMSYADAYEPVADELEAMAQFIRFSTAAAKDKAGIEALTTYALAQRLVRRPEHAGLEPYVADMRRALGGRGKRSKTALARKKQQAAAETPSPAVPPAPSASEEK